jgi:hypothetical protein
MKTDIVLEGLFYGLALFVLTVFVAWAHEKYSAWRSRPRWTAEQQLEHLRLLVQGDHRWLAHNPVADALTARYLDALATDWYARVHQDSAYFRRSIGLEPDYSRKD